MPSRSASNTALVVHDRNGRMIKLKCDYSSLAEMFGRSRDPITSREHRGRGGEGWTVYDEPGIPRTMEKKKRGKSEERERVADWLDRSRQEAHTLLVIQVIQRYGYWSTEFRERINERERERELARLGTEGWIILEANKLRPASLCPRGRKEAVVCPRY